MSVQAKSRIKMRFVYLFTYLKVHWRDLSRTGICSDRGVIFILGLFWCVICSCKLQTAAWIVHDDVAGWSWRSGGDVSWQFSAVIFVFHPAADNDFADNASGGRSRLCRLSNAAVRSPGSIARYALCTGRLRAHWSTVPAAPPMRLPIPNPNPKTHPNPNPIFKESDCVPARGHRERARTRARNGCPFAHATLQYVCKWHVS